MTIRETDVSRDDWYFGPAREAAGSMLNAVRPAVELFARLYMAKIFFDAGWARISNWGSQGFLFESIHPVPFLPASLAAPITTAGELGLAILFALGLFGRAAAAGLLVMSMVIQFVVAQTPEGMENGIGNPVHYLWMLVFLLFVVHGPGRWSADSMIARRG